LSSSGYLSSREPSEVAVGLGPHPPADLECTGPGTRAEPVTSLITFADSDSGTLATGSTTTKKRQGGKSALPGWCLELRRRSVPLHQGGVVSWFLKKPGLQPWPSRVGVFVGVLEVRLATESDPVQLESSSLLPGSGRGQNNRPGRFGDPDRNPLGSRGIRM